MAGTERSTGIEKRIAESRMVNAIGALFETPLDERQRAFLEEISECALVLAGRDDIEDGAPTFNLRAILVDCVERAAALLGPNGPKISCTLSADFPECFAGSPEALEKAVDICLAAACRKSLSVGVSAFPLQTDAPSEIGVRITAGTPGIFSEKAPETEQARRLLTSAGGSLKIENRQDSSSALLLPVLEKSEKTPFAPFESEDPSYWVVPVDISHKRQDSKEDISIKAAGGDPHMRRRLIKLLKILGYRASETEIDAPDFCCELLFLGAKQDATVSETISTVIACRQGCRPPVIAFGKDAEYEAGLAAGAEDYIKEPLSLRKLDAVLKAQLGED